MKILYLECAMGAAGDMLTAALYELLPDKKQFLEKMNALGLPGVTVAAEDKSHGGIRGTHMEVRVHGEPEGPEHHHHAHTHLSDVYGLLRSLDLPESVKQDAQAVYRLIAEAEGRVHGETVEEVHFHEVGALDAAADVVGVCLALSLLRPDRIAASPVATGSGFVRCAHGLLPVPAPATACLLENIPIYSGDIEGELCTPTGAALLRHFAADFGPLPAMRIERTGYGMGSREFARPNCVRAFFGTADGGEEGDTVAELVCQLDDMTPEAVAFAAEELMRAGALDVYTVPAGMKKGRPGLELTCLCATEARREMAGLILRHTTTLGVRERLCRRYTVERRVEVRETPLGPIRIKHAQGWGVEREKPEYEDVARAARDNGLPFAEASRLAGKGEP